MAIIIGWADSLNLTFGSMISKRRHWAQKMQHHHIHHLDQVPQKNQTPSVKLLKGKRMEPVFLGEIVASSGDSWLLESNHCQMRRKMKKMRKIWQSWDSSQGRFRPGDVQDLYSKLQQTVHISWSETWVAET